MPGPIVDPVESDTDLPKSADIVVIGGGIIGCATALELAERGVSVVLLEKGIIAGEQSSRNWGWVRMSRRDPREIDLTAESISLWEGLAERVGADVGYRQCGIVVPFYSPRFKQENLDWLKHIEGKQIRVGAINAEAFHAMVPEMDVAQDGALYSPTDGRAEPQRAAPAIAQAVRYRGGKIVTSCAVRKIEETDGNVTGVITERGRIATNQVIVAGGAWSRLLLRDIGVTLPQLKVLNSVCRTEPVPEGPDVTVRGPNFSMRRRADGGYTVSTLTSNIFDLTPDSFRFMRMFIPLLRKEWHAVRPRVGRRFVQEMRDMRRRSADEVSAYEETRILDPRPSKRMTDRAMASLARVDQRFRNVRIAQRWGGMIDATPDVVPVISKVPQHNGLVVATGFSGHGFGLGPGAGRLTADIATDTTPIVDPTAFRFERFSDGSKIVPMTGV